MVHLKTWTRFFETFPVGPNRDPLSFGPKFPEILVEWIAPQLWRGVVMRIMRKLDKFQSLTKSTETLETFVRAVLGSNFVF